MRACKSQSDFLRRRVWIVSNFINIGRCRSRGRKGEHVFEVMKELGMGIAEREVYGEEEANYAVEKARERGWLREKRREGGEQVLAIPKSVELGESTRVAKGRVSNINRLTSSCYSFNSSQGRRLEAHRTCSTQSS